jgi:glycosyltransferase involved in cell wall biosynthesis
LRLAGFKTLLLTDALVGITWWPRGKVAQFCAAIYANTLGWLILLFATKIIFFHPQPPKVLKRLGITKKSTVIPTGIDPAPYHTGKRSDSVGDVTVTYVGRLESVKGVDDFVAAALKVKRVHPELHVQVVGWFAKDHPLVAAHNLEVTFTGLSHDIPAVLANSDIFVMPSYSEGLSNALMEAMASGCACIASEVGGNAFLLQNGISGLLFDAGDREALVSHIRRLVEDPSKRKSLGFAAQERIQNLFSWEKLGQEYTQLFDSWPAHSK